MIGAVVLEFAGWCRGRCKAEGRLRSKGSYGSSASSVAAAALLLLVAAGPSRAEECVGDCNDNGVVAVDELIKAVNVALGNADLETCTRADRDGNEAVTVDELVFAVNNALGGCAGAATETPEEPTETPEPTATGTPGPPVRDRLLVEDFFAPNTAEMVDNSYFLPIGELAPRTHEFSGTIFFSETKMLTDHPYITWEGSGFPLFPQFSASLISHDGVLIPAQRGLILSGEIHTSPWNVILEPGAVWREVQDGEYSRAAFPFTLTVNGVGQARNGVATFVFNETTMSDVFIQIPQETVPADAFVPADFVGLIPAEYAPQHPGDREDIISGYEQELAERYAVRPWSDLEGSEGLKQTYNGALSDVDLSAAALVIDETIFLQPPQTRAGIYPFPDGMRHGVFSATKSLVAGLSMFYLAERYGESIFDELIADHAPALAAHPGWAGVTFAHTLNMVTGTLGSDLGGDIFVFIFVRTAEDKLRAVAALADAPPAPGTVFNYASTNTFVLSYAMNQYVKAREGADADYWSMVEEDVLKRIGIRHLPVSRTIEMDGSLGTPIGGWGSYPTVDETAKIATLLQNGGAFRGVQLLNRNKVRDALNRSSLSGFADFYKHSFWITEVVSGSGCHLRVPHMTGHGGNIVALLDSGISIVRFTDVNDYSIAPMVAAAERIRSSCD